MGNSPGSQGPREADGTLVPESQIQRSGGRQGKGAKMGNIILSKGVDLKSDLDNGIIEAPADGTPYNDTRSGKGPTNPATGEREPAKKGLSKPFGGRKQDPDFDFQIGFTPQQTINDSDNFAIAAAQNQTNPSQGSSNALFDNFRDEFPAQQEAGGPDDATISAISGTGLASGDKDEGIGQI